MTTHVDWDHWRATWQAPIDEWSPSATDAWDMSGTGSGMVGAALQASRWARAAEIAWLAVAVAAVALAVAHAPTTDDVIMAGVTVALMLGAAYLRWRAAIPASAFASSTTAFLALAVERLEHVRRGLRLAWLLVALDLLFFVRWWADGARHHPSLPAGLVASTVALPLAVLVGFAGWLVWRGRRVEAELDTLRRIQRRVLDVSGDMPVEDGACDVDL